MTSLRTRSSGSHADGNGHTTSRRTFLRAATAAALAGWLVRPTFASDRQLLFVDYPFKLGVTSGTPTASSVVLWTRLAPDPLHGGGMGVQQARVRWQVATDEHFGGIVREGEWWAMAGLAHSVHVTVDGLAPDRVYFYRFIAGNEISPVGRTRTLPEATETPSRFRFALASCQHYELGYFSAYTAMLHDDPDLVLFVGDYIYEYNAASGRVRAHANAEPYSLETYRDRYAQYQLDPHLAAMRAAAPWLMTIDDHEVMNDWAGDTGEDLDPRFVTRRANALQAYFEHVPLPMDALLKDERLSLHRTCDIGRFVRFHVLDDRQYRDAEACSRPGMGGSSYVTDTQCPARRDPKRTILGSTQEAWLDHAFATSKAQWNVVVQQSLVASLRTPSPNGDVYWTDAWDGYPAARDRLMQSLAHRRVSNPLIVGGDYHASIVVNHHAPESESKPLAGEVVGTSITSPGIAADEFADKVAANPAVIYGDSTRRGYVLFDASSEKIDIAIRNMSAVDRPDSPSETKARFVMPQGRHAIEKA